MFGLRNIAPQAQGGLGFGEFSFLVALFGRGSQPPPLVPYKRVRSTSPVREAPLVNVFVMYFDVFYVVKKDRRQKEAQGEEGP